MLDSVILRLVILGYVRLCYFRLGYFRLIYFRLRQVWLFQVKLFQVRLFQVRLGQVIFDQVVLGWPKKIEREREGLIQDTILSPQDRLAQIRLGPGMGPKLKNGRTQTYDTSKCSEFRARRSRQLKRGGLLVKNISWFFILLEPCTGYNFATNRATQTYHASKSSEFSAR